MADKKYNLKLTLTDGTDIDAGTIVVPHDGGNTTTLTIDESFEDQNQSFTLPTTYDDYTYLSFFLLVSNCSINLTIGGEVVANYNDEKAHITIYKDMANDNIYIDSGKGVAEIGDTTSEVKFEVLAGNNGLVNIQGIAQKIN